MSNNSVSIHKTLEQTRASFAWKAIVEASNTLNNKENFKKYVNLVKGLPAFINNNGLGQTLAFIYSKSSFNKQDKKEQKTANAEGVLFKQLQEWLTQENGITSPDPSTDKRSNDYLLHCIMDNNSREYIRATKVTLDLINKMRNFAPGLYEDKYGEKNDKKEPAQSK